jgi:lipoprotein-releasing system ATP-binding protein
MAMVRAEGVTKKYGILEVLKGVDITINAGEILAITGPSGAGKTTLLHILGTLDKPDGGRVFFKDADLLGFGGSQLARFRNRNMGFVFQFHHLLPEFTALENVCIPAFIGGKSKKEAEAKAEELLKLLGVYERREHKPAELSGGENQRVAIARALINEPGIVFADEPSGNLDTQNARELNQVFLNLREKLGQTFVIVTHNPELAGIADREIKMVDGKII